MVSDEQKGKNQDRLCRSCGCGIHDCGSKSWLKNIDVKSGEVIGWLCHRCYDTVIRYPIRHIETKKAFESDTVEKIPCACGCGKMIPKYNRFGNPKKYYWSSHKRIDVGMSKIKSMVMVQCRCGCGQYTKHYLRRGKQVMYYINGHYGKELRIFHRYDTPLDLDRILDGRDARYKAARLYGYMRQRGCMIHNDICGGNNLYLSPLDGNYWNFDIENWVVLCGTHKLLKQKRKLKSIPELLAVRHDFTDNPLTKKRRWFKPNIVTHSPEMRKVLSTERGDYGRDK